MDHQLLLRHLPQEREHVLLDGAKHARISDFGLAYLVDRDTTKLTRTGIGLGTPGYAAPEQYVDASAATKACDIWALGYIAYEIAKRESRAHIEAFRNKFAKMPFEMLLPPGYLSMGSMKRVASAKANLSMEMTLEVLDEQGMFIVGSAATVRERLAEAQKQIGFNHLLPLLQFGTLPHELTMKNATLFAEQVMPQLRPLGEARAKAAE